ncbi:hypothetical protein FOPE_04885 [Fonsecaea pedrosoi]|nr:hypothetical protein FOPE_04885 [Fonsecaea pedrosoi]
MDNTRSPVKTKMLVTKRSLASAETEDLVPGIARTAYAKPSLFRRSNPDLISELSNFFRAPNTEHDGGQFLPKLPPPRGSLRLCQSMSTHVLLIRPAS